jgi:two-component system, OmpR family, sensor histidine kinase KdpD
MYPGAAPGVGKTYEMLLEGHREHEQGVNCVIGFVEPYMIQRQIDPLHWRKYPRCVPGRPG